MQENKPFHFDGHTAFDLNALTVRQLTKILRQLGERGDFARVLKEKQIALIEEHPVDQQAHALRAVGEDPASLQLGEATPEASNAIAALHANAEQSNAAPPPRGKAAMRKARAKPGALDGPAASFPPFPSPAPSAASYPSYSLPEDSVLAWEREQEQQQASVEDDGVPELEEVAAALAKLLLASRRTVDRAMIAEIVRSELARRPNGWSDSD